MGRVSTNSFGLSVARELVPGTPPDSGWKSLEPNSISTFGASVTTVSRAPISKTRQRRKGTVTDLESSVEFEHDLTLDVFDDFVESFLFASKSNSDLDLIATAIASVGFTVATSAPARAKLRYVSGESASLVFVSDATAAANNGLFALTGAATASTLPVSGRTAEASTSATLQLAGLRMLDADSDLTATYANKELTITFSSQAGSFDVRKYGLTVGQFLHVGSVTGAGAVQNALGASSYGYARVKAMTATKIVCDKVDSALTSGLAAGTVVDFLWGNFVRNVSVTDDDYQEISYTIEGLTRS